MNDEWVMIIKPHTNEVKSWQVNQLKDAVQGKSPLVRSWGVMTSENPMGKPVKRTVNREIVLQCKQALKKRGLEYIPVKGRYGGDENSLFVLNPLLKDMMELSRQSDQESFIFATCDDGECNMGYYETGQGYSPYILKHSRNHVVGMDDAEDFFTSVKARSKRAFKFQIPFFDGQDATSVSSESIVNTLEHYVMERYGYQGVVSLSERINETFSRNITEHHRHSLRSMIYETRIARVRRLESCIRSLESVVASHGTSREIERSIQVMRAELESTRR